MGAPASKVADRVAFLVGKAVTVRLGWSPDTVNEVFRATLVDLLPLGRCEGDALLTEVV